MLARTRPTCWPGARRPSRSRSARTSATASRVTLHDELAPDGTRRPLLEEQHPHPPRPVRHPGVGRRDHRHVVRAVVRPYRIDDPQLGRGGRRGATALQLTSVAKFHARDADRRRARARTSIEIRTDQVDRHGREDRHPRPAARDEPRRRRVAPGTEFVQYRWYPDVAARQHLLARPRRRHPRLGPRHGRPADRRAAGLDLPRPEDRRARSTPAPSSTSTRTQRRSRPAAGHRLASASSRCGRSTTTRSTDSTLNLRAEPFCAPRRRRDPSLLFSSYTYGDPDTPLPRAYAGDPFVIRTINVGPGVDTLHVDGHRFSLENRYSVRRQGRRPRRRRTRSTTASPSGSPAILDGGAGGRSAQPGDYLYMQRRSAAGSARAPGASSASCRGCARRPAAAARHPAPAGGPALPSADRRPPAGRRRRRATRARPARRRHAFAVSAVDCRTARRRAAAHGRRSCRPPLARRRHGGHRSSPSRSSCTSRPATASPSRSPTSAALGARASFHVGELLRDPASSGINVGFNPEQTVAPRREADVPLLRRHRARSAARRSATRATRRPARRGSTARSSSPRPARRSATRSAGARRDVGTPGRRARARRARPTATSRLLLADNDPIDRRQLHALPDRGRAGRALDQLPQRGPRGATTPRPFELRSIARRPAHAADPARLRGRPVQVHAGRPPAASRRHVFSLGGLTLDGSAHPAQRRGRSASAVGDPRHAIVGGAGA